MASDEEIVTGDRIRRASQWQRLAILIQIIHSYTQSETTIRAKTMF